MSLLKVPIRPLSRRTRFVLVAALSIIGLLLSTGPLHGTAAALILAVVLYLFIPGFLLSRLLGTQSPDLPPVVRFVWMLSCGLGLCLSLGAILRFLGIGVPVYVLTLHLLALILVALPAPSNQEASWHFTRMNGVFQILLIVASSIVLTISLDQSRYRLAVYDDQSIFTGQVAWLSSNFSDLRVYSRQVGDTGAILRARLDGWTYMEASWSWISGMAAADIFIHSTAPLFSWTIPLIYFAIAYTLVDREDIATLSALVAVLFGMVTLDDLTRGGSNIAFGQYALFSMDTLRKISTALIFPLAIFTTLAFLTRLRVRLLIPMLLLQGALIAIHPRQYGLYLLSVGLCASLRLLAHFTSRRGKLLVLIGAVVVGMLAVVIGLNIIGRSVYPQAQNYPSEVAYLLANPISIFGEFTVLYNVPLLGTTIILSPRYFFYHPLLAWSVLWAAWIGIRHRTSLAGQYILTATGAALGLAFFPGIPELLIRLLGLDYTRFVIGVLFMIPVPLIVAISVDRVLRFVDFLSARARIRRYRIAFVSIILTGLMLVLLLEPVPIAGSTREQMATLEALRSPTYIRSFERELLAGLTKILPDNMLSILVTPGRVAGLVVESFPRTMVANSRPADVDTGAQRFQGEAEPWLDRADIDFLRRVKATHVILEHTSTRVPQLLLQSERFEMAGDIAGYFVFRIHGPLLSDPSDALFEAMNAHYRQVEHPRWKGTSFDLVRPGVDWTFMVTRWQESLSQQPDNTMARLGLATAYVMSAQDDLAIPLWETLHREHSPIFMFGAMTANLRQHHTPAHTIDGSGPRVLSAMLNGPSPSLQVQAAQVLLTEPFFYTLEDSDLEHIIDISHQWPSLWDHLVEFDRLEETKRRINLLLARGYWATAVEWLDRIPRRDLSAGLLANKAVALLAQGHVEEALLALRPTVDEAWLAAPRFVHPDRWADNVAAQLYYLLHGERALRAGKLDEAVDAFRHSVDAGSRWAGRYFLARAQIARGETAQGEALLLAVRNAWASEHGVPLPDLISVLSTADTRQLYVLQPTIQRSAEARLRITAVYGMLYDMPYAIQQWRFILSPGGSASPIVVQDSPAIQVPGTLVRADRFVQLPDSIPPLTQAQLLLEPRYNNRIRFVPGKVSLVLNRPDSAVPDPGSVSLNLTFANQISLKGYRYDVSENVLRIVLYWSTGQPIEEDYQVFIHILDAQGRLVHQQDTTPVSGRYPTSQWRPAVVIEDAHQLTLDTLAPDAPYTVYVGLYRLSGGQRLAITSRLRDVTGDAYKLGQFRRSPSP
jgi:hypothetical protein